MSDLGYSVHSNDPAGGRFNPMDKFIVPYIKEFTIVDASTYYDYITATNDSGDTIPIAKPRLFRGNYLDDSETTLIMGGITVNPSYNQNGTVTAVDASGTEDTEMWYITPDYQVGELITAIYKNIGVSTDEGEVVEWEDMNLTGRCWAAE